MVLSRLTKITGPGVATDTNWVGNNADFTGITTSATSFNIGVTTIHSTLIESHNIVSTGIITATGGSFSGNVTAVDGTFTGNVSIAGTLTYEDVTNIDAVGIITAPALDVDDFLDVGSNIKLGNAGVITATSFVGSGAALTGIDATAIKDSGGNVKIQAQASGAIHSGISTFQDIDVDGHTNLDNVSVAGITTHSGSTTFDSNITFNGSTSNANWIKSGNKFRLNDNSKVNFGGGDNLQVYHTGTAGYITNNAGAINITGADGVTIGAGISAVGVITATSFVGSGANLTSLPAQATIANNADNRIITGGSGVNLNGEANLTFDGSNVIHAGGDGRRYSFAGGGSSHYMKFDSTLNGIILNGYGGIAFETNGTNERLRIHSDGKISTGVNNNSYELTIGGLSGGPTLWLRDSGTSGAPRILFGSTAGALIGGITYNNSSNHMEFATNGNEKVRITSAGILLAGHTSSPTSDADKLQVISTSSGTGICLHNYSASNYGNQIAFMKSRNNTIGSNTLLNTGDRIGELNFYGNDGSGRSLGAQIQVMASGTQSNNNSPSRINFLTGLNQSMNTRLAIHPAGTVGVSKGGYANSDHSMSLTVHTGTDLNDGLMIISNYNGGNQNSDTGKLMFCGSGQTNGVYIYKDNEVSYGKGALVFHTRSTANDYSTQLAETARFTAYGRFGLGTGGPGQTTVDSLMHIQGNSDDGDAACQLTIEDEDTSAGSKIPSIQFKGNGVNTGRIRGTDTGGITFATWNGSSDIQRAIIGNHAEGGAMLLNADDRGWATFRHNNNQGLRTHIRQRYAPGNAVSTHTILRIRRHWWGWGTYKIRCKALYYNSSLESTYFVNGHGSGGNSYSIGHETYGGDVSSQNWNCTVTHTASNNAPGSSSTWYADINVNIPNYYYAIIYIEAYSSSYSTDPNNISADGYCLM